MTGATACGEAEAVLALVLTFGAIVGASLLAKSLALVARADGVAGKPAPTQIIRQSRVGFAREAGKVPLVADYRVSRPNPRKALFQ